MTRNVDDPEDDWLMLRVRTSIRRLRLEAGKTQAQMGEVLGLRHDSMTNLELGRRQLTALEAIKLARWLGVSVDTLLGSEEDSGVHWPA